MLALVLLLCVAIEAKDIQPLPNIPNSCLYVFSTPHRPDPRDGTTPFTPENVCQFADSFALSNVPTVPVGRIYPDQPGGGTETNGWRWQGDGGNLTIIAPAGGVVGAHSVYVKQGTGGNIFYYPSGVFRTHSLSSPDGENIESITFCQAPNSIVLQRAIPLDCTGFFCRPVPCCGFDPFVACAPPPASKQLCGNPGITFELTSFGNSRQSDEIYVGVDANETRAGTRHKWKKGYCYNFEFSFNATEDKLTAFVSKKGRRDSNGECQVAGSGWRHGECGDGDKRRDCNSDDRAAPLLKHQQRDQNGHGDRWPWSWGNRDGDGHRWGYGHRRGNHWRHVGEHRRPGHAADRDFDRDHNHGRRDGDRVSFENWSTSLASQGLCDSKALLYAVLEIKNDDPNTSVSIHELALDVAETGAVDVTPQDYTATAELPLREYNRGFMYSGSIDLDGEGDFSSSEPTLSSVALKICCK